MLPQSSIEHSPLIKGAARSGGCPFGLWKPSRQPPEGFATAVAFFPPFLGGFSEGQAHSGL